MRRSIGRGGLSRSGCRRCRGMIWAGLPLPDRSASDMLLRLLGSPNIASKEWVYRQYDHQVQTNTVAAPGGDAAVLRIKGTGKG